MTVSETNKILENSLENLRKKNYIKSFEFFVSSKNSENGDPIGLNSYFFYIEFQKILLKVHFLSNLLFQIFKKVKVWIKSRPILFNVLNHFHRRKQYLQTLV